MRITVPLRWQAAVGHYNPSAPDGLCVNWDFSSPCDVAPGKAVVMLTTTTERVAGEPGPVYSPPSLVQADGVVVQGKNAHCPNSMDAFTGITPGGTLRLHTCFVVDAAAIADEMPVRFDGLWVTAPFQGPWPTATGKAAPAFENQVLCQAAGHIWSDGECTEGN